MSTTDVDSEGTAASGQVFTSTRWSVIGRVVCQLLRFVSIILLATMLSPSDFGIMGMALFVLGFIRLFRTLGTSQALIQKAELSPALLDSVFWVNFAFSSLLAVAVWLCAGPIAWLFGEPAVAPVLAFLAIQLVLLAPSDVSQALLNRRMAFKALAVTDVAATLIYIVAVLGLAYLGFGVWALAIAATAEAALQTAAFLVTARWRPHLRFSMAEIRQIFGFSLNLSAFNVVNFTLVNADKPLVGRFLGAGDLGLYTMSNRIVGISVQYVQPAFINVLFPAMARSADDDARLVRGVHRASTGLALVFLPLFGGIAAVADVFVRVAFSPEWAMLALLLPAFAARYALESINRVSAVLYRVKGRTDLQFYWGVATGVICLAAYVIGLQWGLAGVVAAQVVAALLLVYPSLHIPLKLIGVPVPRFLRALLPHAACTVLMIVAVRGVIYAAEPWLGYDLLLLLAAIAAGVVTYGLAVLALRPAGAQDLLRLAGYRPHLAAA